jgi:hypothetical protein
LLKGFKCEFVGQKAEHWYDDGEIVGVCFHEIVTRYRGRIDMMFTEIAQEILSN